MSKVDNFDALILRYPESIQAILRDLDEKVRGLALKAGRPIAIQRYTTDVPDIRYRVRLGSFYKPVFLRVRPRRDKVRLEIETVDDPSGRTEPREKSGRWRSGSPDPTESAYLRRRLIQLM